MFVKTGTATGRDNGKRLWEEQFMRLKGTLIPLNRSFACGQEQFQSSHQKGVFNLKRLVCIIEISTMVSYVTVLFCSFMIGKSNLHN
jgi:hypothetical protein